MRKLVYYVAVSLDGYIAGPGGEVDFYPLSDSMAAWINERYPETVPTHIRPQAGLQDAPNRAFDTIIMGRGTYEPALAVGITSPYAHLRQLVVSTTLGTIPDPAVELVSTDPVEAVRKLKAEDGLDIWLAGGGQLAGALLPEIDELIVKSYPVVGGAGLPAFAGPFRPTAFTRTDLTSFDNGASVSWFSRTPNANA
ncbi:dihydrofolate reductase family protein [Rhodococcus sp. W8901]|uniref:dihydrofolate reductase family protein n=1 Tax=Rhodococcus sp. W8901 TaxID=2742603 RepID=UPI001581A407|nr:dihydrofolate reductase family protein [Rhodococcus sp. W8901]QKT11257.1 dihydrofolate reductase [Rhodococcus sp. W8901]